MMRYYLLLIVAVCFVQAAEEVHIRAKRQAGPGPGCENWVYCMSDPCATATCPKFPPPAATCVVDNCRGVCQGLFYTPNGQELSQNECQNGRRPQPRQPGGKPQVPPVLKNGNLEKMILRVVELMSGFNQYMSSLTANGRAATQADMQEIGALGNCMLRTFGEEMQQYVNVSQSTQQQYVNQMWDSGFNLQKIFGTKVPFMMEPEAYIAALNSPLPPTFGQECASFLSKVPIQGVNTLKADMKTAFWKVYRKYFNTTCTNADLNTLVNNPATLYIFQQLDMGMRFAGVNEAGYAKLLSQKMTPWRQQRGINCDNLNFMAATKGLYESRYYFQLEDSMALRGWVIGMTNATMMVEETANWFIRRYIDPMHNLPKPSYEQKMATQQQQMQEMMMMWHMMEHMKKD